MCYFASRMIPVTGWLSVGHAPQSLSWTNRSRLECHQAINWCGSKQAGVLPSHQNVIAESCSTWQHRQLDALSLWQVLLKARHKSWSTKAWQREREQIRNAFSPPNARDLQSWKSRSDFSCILIIHCLQVCHQIFKKRINVRIEHVAPSRCREDFLRRVKANDSAKHEAKLKNGELEPLAAVHAPIWQAWCDVFSHPILR